MSSRHPSERLAERLEPNACSVIQPEHPFDVKGKIERVFAPNA